MEWIIFREKAANYAGLIGFLANFALLNKSFYESGFNVSYFFSMETLTALMFITAMIIFHRKGHLHRGIYIGMFLACFGNITLIMHEYFNESYSAIPGLLIGLAMLFWSGFSALLNEKKAILDQKTQKKVIFDQYPNAIPMSVNATSNTLVAFGAFIDSNAYLGFVALGWAVSSILLAISMQKTSKKVKQPLFY